MNDLTRSKVGAPLFLDGKLGSSGPLASLGCDRALNLSGAIEQSSEYNFSAYLKVQPRIVASEILLYYCHVRTR